MSRYGMFPPYQSVAERAKKAQARRKALEKKGQRLAPVDGVPGRGKLTQTFWGKSWCDNLERYSDLEYRLERGRSYARHGAVIHLEVKQAKIHALVSGTELYTVNMEIAPVSEASWRGLTADCAGAVGSMVELLRGALDQEVMSRICREDAGLFPHPEEISFRCSCPDFAMVCKHVAAALLGVGIRLDTEPELLFALRGVDPEDLVSAALAHAPPAADDGRALAIDDDLADLFGVEMDLAEAAPARGASARKKANAPVELEPKTPRRRATAKSEPEAPRRRAATKKGAEPAPVTPPAKKRTRRTGPPEPVPETPRRRAATKKSAEPAPVTPPTKKRTRRTGPPEPVPVPETPRRRAATKKSAEPAPVAPPTKKRRGRAS